MTALKPVTTTTLDTTGGIARVIARYSGCRVLELECALDPLEPGCFAFRALLKGEGNAFSQEFLVRRAVSIAHVAPGDLEEVTFTNWPPFSTAW